MKSFKPFTFLILFTLSLATFTSSISARADVVAFESAMARDAEYWKANRAFADAVMESETDFSTRRKKTLVDQLFSSPHGMQAASRFMPTLRAVRTIYLPQDTEKKHPISIWAVPTIESAPHAATCIKLVIRDVIAKNLELTAEIVDRYFTTVKELPLLGGKPWTAK